jgi:hypothetical protein
MRALPVPEEIVESVFTSIITNPPEREIRMTFRKQAQEFTLIGRGVDHLLVNEFLQQNIVDEIRVFERNSELSTVRNLIANLLFDSEHASEVTEPGSIDQLEKRVKAVIDGNKVLLEVLPVYGASVLLFATSIEWLDTSTARKES